MRNLLIAGLAVASLTGIAYAQNVPEIWRDRGQISVVQRRPFVPQCQRMDDVKVDVNTVIENDGQQFRCTAVYDEWLVPTSRAAWVKVASR